MNNYVGYKRLYINPIGTSHHDLYLVYGKETTLIGKWYIPSIILSNVGASRAEKIRNKASWKNMRNKIRFEIMREILRRHCSILATYCSIFEPACPSPTFMLAA